MNNIAYWREQEAIYKAKRVIDLTKEYWFDNMLDIGSREGFVIKELKAKGVGRVNIGITALEIEKELVEQLRAKGIQAIEYDGYNLDMFKDNEFDLVTCLHVIEHTKYPRMLLENIKRISKYQIFEIPCEFSFTIDKKFEDRQRYGHLETYTPALFRFLLYTVGYKILDDRYAFNQRQSKNRIRTFILKHSFLRKIKPNTYTVLTH